MQCYSNSERPAADLRLWCPAGEHSHAEGGEAEKGTGRSVQDAADITGPEERLAFALSDGRVGVLAVKGRKVYARSLRSFLTA